MEVSLIPIRNVELSYEYFIIVNFNQSRAISTTRTVFRLNTNQSHAYEDTPYSN